MDGRIKAMRGRYSLPEETVTVAVVTREPDPASRFKLVAAVGSSLMPDKDATVAVPIPSSKVPDEELRTLTEEEMEAATKIPLHLLGRRALARLGNEDYLVRTGQHDHKTFYRFLTATAPKELQIGPTDNLYELTKAALKFKTLQEAEVLING